MVMKQTGAESWRGLYPFKSNYLYLPAEGQRLHYVDEGPAPGAPQGEPILCVHGNPTWSFFYRALVQHFKDKHRVVVPDHLGMGLSDKPQDYDYTLENHIFNLETLVDKLGLPPFTLVVHDWGGPIGLGYAVRHPERIKRVMIMNTAAFRSKRMPWTIRLARVPFWGALLVRGFNAFVRGALRVCASNPLSPAVRAGYLAPYDSWAHRVAVLRFVCDVPLSPSHPSYKTLVEVEQGLLRLSRAPKMLVWGAQDHVFGRDFLARWQSIYPDAEARSIETANHYLLEDAPQVVIQALEELLER